MTTWFEFGQRRPEFDVPVLNERAVRAAAGMLFALALVAFMQAWLVGNFGPTRVFVLGFLLDFSIRLFINPRLAPSMVLGQWMVRTQEPEWTGAAQKRFAWALGYALAVAMFVLIVVKGTMGPVNLLACLVCLTLMFFESAFGICLGCWLYNRIHRQPARLCPGGACSYQPGADTRVVGGQWAVALGCVVLLWGLAPWVLGQGPHPAEEAPPAVGSAAPTAEEAERCKVPEFAKAIGHEQKWKQHHHCP